MTFVLQIVGAIFLSMWAENATLHSSWVNGMKLLGAATLLVFAAANAASATVNVGVTFIEAFEVSEDGKQTLESNSEEPIVVIKLDENGEEIITYIFQ